MPYFNRALLVIPRDLPPTLLCGLSPRVYGWIRSVTTIEDVRPAGNFAKPLVGHGCRAQVDAAWRVWIFDQFPYDLFKSLQSSGLEFADM